MQACPQMKAVIEQLAQKHGINLAQPQAHFRLDLPGFDRLVVENIGQQCLSVAHYFESNGDLVAEPDIVFWTGEQGQWQPIEISQSLTGWRNYVQLSADYRKFVAYHRAGQASLAEFAEQWAQNLVAQGWLEHGHLHVWSQV